MATFFKPTKKSTLENKLLTLTVERLDPNGRGVSHYQNKKVFIDNTLPSEVVKVKVVEQNSKFIKAHLVNVITPSDDRITPVCQHFFQCGGCDLQHLVHQAQLDFKQKKVMQLFNREGITADLPWQAAIVSDEFNYRRKARIGVQYNKLGEPIVGFRKQGSNQLTTIKHCDVLEPIFNDVFSQLNTVLKQLSADKSVGHIEVIQANVTCIVVRQLVKMPAADKALWLSAQSEHQWQVLIDDGKKLSPLLESSSAKTLFYTLMENTVNQTQINFSANDFIQVNNVINQKMVAQALQWLELEPTDSVLDLFCGLGNFSLPIAKQVSQVVGVEGVQAMVDKATNNAQLNGVDNCQFFQADLNSQWINNSNQHWHQHHFNKILLDPARAGAEQAVQQLTTIKAEKILYVSCDPTTLARDSAILIQQGYAIKKIALMDMFSQTKHIETMVVFELNK